jgi:DNA-binding IclR family transcriptional regulator
VKPVYLSVDVYHALAKSPLPTTAQQVLDFVVYAESERITVTQKEVALTLDMNISAARRALARLTSRNLIEQGARVGRTNTYRLCSHVIYREKAGNKRWAREEAKRRWGIK